MGSIIARVEANWASTGEGSMGQEKNSYTGSLTKITTEEGMLSGKEKNITQEKYWDKN